MGYASGFIIGYIFFAFLFFIIGVFITRWIFRINKIIRLQEKQYAVFTLMAMKMNVDKNELLRIENPQQYWYEQQQKKNDEG
jgi:presenilin-like A22 family membrane protease